MRIEDIVRSDVERLFIIDRECFVIYTGNSLEDDKPFIRIGNYIDLPVDLIPLVENIVITDLNNDGIPEIVVNRSIDSVARFLPNSMKYFDKSEIVSLSWDQLGLVENWKTRDISGMVTAIRLGDLDNNGSTELIGSLVLAKDFLKLWDSKSTIFSYDLNVSKQAPARQ